MGSVFSQVRLLQKGAQIFPTTLSRSPITVPPCNTKHARHSAALVRIHLNPCICSTCLACPLYMPTLSKPAVPVRCMHVDLHDVVCMPQEVKFLMCLPRTPAPPLQQLTPCMSCTCVLHGRCPVIASLQYSSPSMSSSTCCLHCSISPSPTSASGRR